MLSRRRFNSAAATLSAGMPTLVARTSGAAGGSYEDAVRDIWRHGPADLPGGGALQRELVRYATLAPSSHNTQCWTFGLQPGVITIRPDFARRCPAVDPDDHHVFVSLGCAAENLSLAALAHGLMTEVHFDAAGDRLQLALQPTAMKRSSLFEAIPQRQSTRAEYDGQPVSTADLKRLEQAAAGDGVQLVMLTEKPALARVLDFVVQGNTTQMNDRAFVDELKSWIRFSASDAVRRGDGLFGASSGNPTLPAWLGPLVFGIVFTPARENDRITRQLRSSAGVAVFSAPADNKAGWIAAGRAFERFALQATAMGVRTAHLNQPVEVASLRAPFASLVGMAGRRPDLVIRFGRGPTLPASLRRPLQAVLA